MLSFFKKITIVLPFILSFSALAKNKIEVTSDYAKDKESKQKIKDHNGANGRW